ncbi:uncharacterized protein [Gossypium hirsutum]|uniref:Uncharacterized protein n=2 Tax=Gossypium TaxID=3633 RepID=A0A1U8HJU5_GOSHI|nr:uncharacterized protein LOC107886778 [Gossypium hirsutum]
MPAQYGAKFGRQTRRLPLNSPATRRHPFNKTPHQNLLYSFPVLYFLSIFSQIFQIKYTSNMVVPLGPGKFYGSSLPRPRIYSETRFNSERVDPPVPVLDPLLSWANEAHWSMGGLSFKRLRLQGRIEGNVQRLKAQRDKFLNNKDPVPKKNNRDASLSPPAPVAVKRKRFLDLNDEDEEDVESENEENEIVMNREEKRVLRKGAVRKLGDDFERVAKDKDSGVASGGKWGFSDGIGIDVMKIVEEVNVESGEIKKKKKRIVKGLKKGTDEVQSGTGTTTRVSPRLAKRGC